jgi:glycosyltransferase involved in cell wall biosynthesis
MRTRKTVMSIFALRPNVVGGLQTFAAELSRQLAGADRESVLVFLSSPIAEVASLFELANTHVETIENCGTANTGALNRTFRLLRRYRPETVHFHLIGSPVLYAWLAKLCGTSNVFLTDHISRPPRGCTASVHPWKRLAKRFSYVPVTKVVCVSDFVRNCQSKEGALAENRLCRVYNGVDVARADSGAGKRAEFRRLHDIPDDRVVVLQASWLIPEKGIDDLLQAAKVVLSRSDNVHFVIAGDGAFREEYQRLGAELGIDHRVSFVGVVSDPLGEGLFAASDIVCQVSRWEEAFGLTIAEAMASGKPVIGTLVGGIPELIVDGQTGYLVARSDSSGLAERILSLVNDGQLRISLGLAGKRRCQEKFDLVDNVATLIEHYGICGQLDEK